MKEIIVYCTKCGEAILYSIPRPIPINPKKWCNRCKYQFPVGKYLKNPSKKKVKTPKMTPQVVSHKNPIPPQNSVNGPPVVSPNYDNVNIKALIKNTAIDIIKSRDPRNLGKALDILTKPEFITQGEIKHGIYWTSETPSYERPFWLFPWQGPAIDMFGNGTICNIR